MFVQAQDADVGVSPPRVAILAAPGETVTSTIGVTSDGVNEIQAQVGDWTLDSAGNISFFPAGSLLYSASTWVALESDILTTRENRFTDFRFTVRVPETEVAGTYQTMVFFSTIPSAEAAEADTAIVSRVGVAVYVTVTGSETYGAELIDFTPAGSEGLTLVVGNLGNTLLRVEGRVELRDEVGAVVATLPFTDLPVLREAEREITVALPGDLEPGFYIAVAFVEDSRGGVLAGELTFDIEE